MSYTGDMFIPKTDPRRDSRTLPTAPVGFAEPIPVKGPGGTDFMPPPISGQTLPPGKGEAWNYKQNKRAREAKAQGQQGPAGPTPTPTPNTAVLNPTNPLTPPGPPEVEAHVGMPPTSPPQTLPPRPAEARPRTGPGGGRRSPRRMWDQAEAIDEA